MFHSMVIVKGTLSIIMMEFCSGLRKIHPSVKFIDELPGEFSLILIVAMVPVPVTPAGSPRAVPM